MFPCSKSRPRFDSSPLCSRVGGLALLCWLSTSAAVWPAPPSISQISLRGLRIGGTTTIAIDGSDLLPGAELLLGAPVAHQTVRPGGTPQHVEVEVALDETPVPGIYDLRLANPAGVSNAVAIGIDVLAQMPLAPQTTSLPAALTGTLGGGQTAETSVELKKGQPLVVEVEAKRIGAAIDPVLHVLDQRNVPLAWAEGKSTLGGDARLSFAAPADGRYRIQLNDATYQAGSPGQFRLKIGQFYFADLVFPLAAVRGTKTTLQFASTNLPNEAKVDWTPAGGAAIVPPPWPGSLAVSGFRPQLALSDASEVVQSHPADTATAGPQQVTAPVGISGRLTTPQEDHYRVAVEPGARLRIEVTAARIGSPLDGILTVRDEQGHDLASNDDQPTTIDPGLDFTVPGDRHAIVVALKDVAGRSGPDYVYHLTISRLDQPDFSLALDADRLNIPPTGNGLLRVGVLRRNYAGPIKLAFVNLPPGVQVTNDEIQAGDDEVLVALTAAGAAPGHAIISVVGRAVDTPSPLVRTALAPDDRAETKAQPWLRADLACALLARPALSIAWTEPSAATTLKAGGKLPLKLKLTRGAGANGPVRLSLVSTQRTPMKLIKSKNPKKIPPKEVLAPERTLRLQGAPAIAADATEATAELLVPADLPLHDYDLAVRAELLNADGQRVEATTYTSVLRAEVLPPPAADPNQPLVVFEDQPEFVANLNQGGGTATLETRDKYSGKAAVKVTLDQRLNPALPGLGVKIRQNPGPGEYRYLRFAWKKKGGEAICIQLNHDGNWGPTDDPKHKFRYHAGSGPEPFGASLAVAPKAPDKWVVVTRDLYADFGEFTFTGLALSPVDGLFGLYDHIYLAKKPADFELIKP